MSRYYTSAGVVVRIRSMLRCVGRSWKGQQDSLSDLLGVVCHVTTEACRLEPLHMHYMFCSV